MNGLPNGWYQTTVGDSAKFLTGFPFASSNFSLSGVKLVRGSNVKRAAMDWNPDLTRYWPKTALSLRVFHLEENDIVIAMDGALVGRSYALISKKDLPAYLVQRVARLRGRSIDQGLLYAWIGSDQFVSYVDSVKTHTAIPHISPRDIREFLITAPVARTEQRRIATALADTDNLTAVLEQLIAKKQAIKQGMMQQLLTGKTRLPGFSECWKAIAFGDLAAPVRERIHPHAAPRTTLLVELEHLASGEGRLAQMLTANQAISLKTTFRPGDVLFGKLRAYLRKYWLADTAGICSTEIWALRPRALADGAYIRYLVETDRFIDSASGGYGTHMPRSDWGTLKRLEFSVPPFDEQHAVATVLSDADAEIDALRRRLEKAKAIKQGMMQELLTGHTRLPVKDEAAA